MVTCVGRVSSQPSLKVTDEYASDYSPNTHGNRQVSIVLNVLSLGIRRPHAVSAPMSSSPMRSGTTQCMKTAEYTNLHFYTQETFELTGRETKGPPFFFVNHNHMKPTDKEAIESVEKFIVLNLSAVGSHRSQVVFPSTFLYLYQISVVTLSFLHFNLQEKRKFPYTFLGLIIC